MMQLALAALSFRHLIPLGQSQAYSCALSSDASKQKMSELMLHFNPQEGWPRALESFAI